MKAPKDLDEIPESDVLSGYEHPRHAQHIIGHEKAEAELLEAYKADRLPQAWIIGGPSGIGKATLAWRLTKFIMANPDPSSPHVQKATCLDTSDDNPQVRQVLSLTHSDLLLMRRSYNPSTKRFYSEIRADDVRKANDMFHLAANNGGWRIGILDSADELNKFSANALLKLIEEPPPRSLFLIIAHHPSRLLPTIRSRARKIYLSPLTPDQIKTALKTILTSSRFSTKAISQAAEMAGGSVREALRLLEGDGLDIAAQMSNILRGMPRVDWKSVLDLSDIICARDADDDFSSALMGIYDWLDAQIQDNAGLGAERLAPLALVWDKIAKAVRHTEAINLDKRALLVSIFTDLAEAYAETARS
jgi:DNA polymerase III subunit delta'